MGEIKRIPKDKLPCKYFSSWWEDVAGDGGPRMYMTDCSNESDDFDDSMSCDNTCKYYEAVAPQVCEKHGEYIGCCEECMFEDYKAVQ